MQKNKGNNKGNPFNVALDDLNHIRKYGYIIQQGGDKIDKLWNFLDSQSTVDVICNPKMLQRISNPKMLQRIKKSTCISVSA